MESFTMKKLMVCVLTVLCTIVFSAEKIYRSTSKAEKDIVCYYRGSKFYSDNACKKLIYNHPGNYVSKEKTANAKNAIYRLIGGRIHKGASLKKEDCLGTIVVTRSNRGNVEEAKIYKGYCIVRDVVRKTQPKGVEIITDYKITDNGLSEGKPAALLYTIKNNRIFRGDSTKDTDCVLSYTAPLNNSRLLFVVFELIK